MKKDVGCFPDFVRKTPHDYFFENLPENYNILINKIQTLC